MPSRRDRSHCARSTSASSGEATTARPTTPPTAAEPAWSSASTSCAPRSRRPTAETVEAILAARRVAVLTPVGRELTDAVVTELAGLERLTLLAGRYEGFDQRVHDHLANDEISVGRYVLSGGEIAAMAVVDAVTRKLHGALGSARATSTTRTPRRSAACPNTRTTPGRSSSGGGGCRTSCDRATTPRWRGGGGSRAPRSAAPTCEARPGWLAFFGPPVPLSDERHLRHRAPPGA